MGKSTNSAEDESLSTPNEAPDTAPEAVDEPVVEVAAPKARRKLSAVAVVEKFKAYATTEKHTYPLDIQVSNETINGQWSREDGFVEFLVPEHLVEGFEMHYHFRMGNIVAVAE
jgi:hypothetical protein